MARGERKFRGSIFRGPYKAVISDAPCSNMTTKTKEAEAKPRTSQAKTSTSKDQGTSRTKDKARQGKPRHEGQGQTSRGNLHQSDSDWGEFLLKFDLGLHVASLVMSTPLFVKLFMCGAGGAQVLG